MNKMRGNSLYLVRLYSLPRPEDHGLWPDVYLQEYVNTQRPYKEGQPPATAEWIASISFRVEKQMRKIHVSFPYAPDEYGFQEYYVYLAFVNNLNNANQTALVRRNTNSLFAEHTFENVVPGSYVIRIQPQDPHFNDDARCLCYKGASNNRQCQQCAMTTTHNFDVQPPTVVTTAASSTFQRTDTPPRSSSSGSTETAMTPKEEKSQGGEEMDVGKVVGAVCGVFLALILIGVVGFFAWRKIDEVILIDKPHTGPGPNPELQSCHTINSGELSFYSPKRIFLVYSEDHTAHQRAVESLAKLLQTRCNCEVLYAPWFQQSIGQEGLFRWLVNNMDQADFIIIVNSEGAFKLVQAWKISKPYTQLESSPTGDLFIPAMRHIYGKLITQISFGNILMTYFDHTRDDFILPELNPGMRYKLVKHFPELLKYIHGDQACQDDPRIQGQDLTATTEGHFFLEAVKKAEEYELDNPSWFSKRFQQTQKNGIKISRLDSGFSSVSDEDRRRILENNDFDPDGYDNRGCVESSMDPQFYDFSPDDLDAQSYITYKPSMIDGQQFTADDEVSLSRGSLHNVPVEESHDVDFEAPLDPDEIVDAFSVSPSEALRDINRRNEIPDLQFYPYNNGDNCRVTIQRDWDTESGKSV